MFGIIEGFFERHEAIDFNKDIKNILIRGSNDVNYREKHANSIILSIMFVTNFNKENKNEMQGRK